MTKRYSTPGLQKMDNLLLLIFFFVFCIMGSALFIYASWRIYPNLLGNPGSIFAGGAILFPLGTLILLRAIGQTFGYVEICEEVVRVVVPWRTIVYQIKNVVSVESDSDGRTFLQFKWHSIDLSFILGTAITASSFRDDLIAEIAKREVKSSANG